VLLQRSFPGAASRWRRAAAGMTATALLAAAPLLAFSAASAQAATPRAATPRAASAPAASAPAASAQATGTTAGASVPFTEYLAQNAATNGTVLAPDYTVGTLASEATGRQATFNPATGNTGWPAGQLSEFEIFS